jgi:hypothetical protein
MERRSCGIQVVRARKRSARCGTGRLHNNNAPCDIMAVLVRWSVLSAVQSNFVYVAGWLRCLVATPPRRAAPSAGTNSG